jgi:hypothetical protein
VRCYSRDEFADPLRALDEVIKMIRDGACFPDAERSGHIAAPPEQARQCRDLEVAADVDAAAGDVTRKPQADEGDVATPHEVPEDEPMLSLQVRRADACRPEGMDPEEACRPDCSGASREAGKAVGETSDRLSAFFSETLESVFYDVACRVCDETMDLACLGLCIRSRDCSASSVWKSEGAMTMLASESSWHAVAIAPLEMRRRKVRRSAGLLLTDPRPSGARIATATESLISECPALRRHQNLVKTGLQC